ncbi:MAG: hypothetical protein ACLFQV_00005 [Vulcanimicrobiota bacterium]
MKRIIPIITGIIIVILIAIFAIPASRIKILGTQLSYEYFPEQERIYKITTHMNMETKIENPSEELTQAFSDKKIELEMNQDSIRQVKGVNGGIANLLVTNQVKDTRVVVNGQEIPDPAQLDNKTTLSLSLTPSGNIQNLVAISPEKLKGQEEDLKETLLFTHQFVSFPNKILRPGQKWNREISAPLQIGFLNVVLEGNMEYTFTGLVKNNGSLCARIDFIGNFNSDTTEENTTKMNGKGETRGSILFDFYNGELISVENHAKLQTEVPLKRAEEGSAELADFKITGNTEIDIKMEKKNNQAEDKG